MAATTLRDTTRALILDIEGTTTSIAFVYDTLFPFARAHMADFLERQWDDEAVQADVALVRAQASQDVAAGDDRAVVVPDGPPDAARAATITNLLAQMDGDRKTTGLKSIQGKIWLDGYASGTLRGHVYDDVPPAFTAWRSAELRLHIYSSGSVAAQRLLFGSSVAGDLTPQLHSYFDTTTGPKKERGSYTAICAQIGLDPAQVGFLTDNLAEAQAAHEAGLQAIITIRPGNPALPEHTFPTISSFAELTGAS